jgi:pyruvate/2-oxoacid:ferredoxin oxidoreductase alpha subunit/pyruvate/2-oxoacid:ferredoxin oxidoreductase beta subunit
MVNKELMNGNEAAARAAMLSRVQVLPEYEITPSSKISELLAEYCADGRLNATYIPVESEHSAMAACIGASYTGARTFTASASHGTALMHEMLHCASSMRRPIVFVNTNRAIGLPWNIWTDQLDSLSQRDTGWLQIYTENVQETLDTVIMAFKITEDLRLRLPVMVVTEGFILSHSSEPVEVPEQDIVDEFLPPVNPIQTLDIRNPQTFGGLTLPKDFFHMKIDAQKAMEKAREVVKEVDTAYGALFNRSYGLIEKFHWDNPSTVLVTTGTITSTARHLLINDPAFKDVGLLKLRLFRPFPAEEVREALKEVKKVAVIDRNISLGHEGIFFQEIKSALYSLAKRPFIFGFVAGLGGVDVTVDTIKEALNCTLSNDIPKKGIYWLPATIEQIEPEESPSQNIEIIKQFPKDEFLYWGHSACAGCGEAIAWRHVLRAMGEKTYCVIPAGCSSVIGGIWPHSSLKVPAVHCNFEAAASTAAGISRALEAMEQEGVKVLVCAGDGGTYDIGLASLSGAAERGDDIVYVCLNNEAYMNTGIQRSGSTPWGAWTTTTPVPQPKAQSKKNLVDILAAHRIPYAATACISYPRDLERKIKKARRIQGGLKYIDLLCPCPAGWRFPDNMTVEMGRQAVLSGIFPLYEISNGNKITINRPVPHAKLSPIKLYISLQGRFSHLVDEDIEEIQSTVDREWQRLLKKA